MHIQADELGSNIVTLNVTTDTVSTRDETCNTHVVHVSMTYMEFLVGYP